MLESVFSLRLSHTGVYADGRPNSEPVLVNDLDDGSGEQRFQNHKVPVYVPVNGFIEIPLTSKALFSFTQGAIAGLYEEGIIQVDVVSPGSRVAGSALSVVDGQSTSPFEDGSFAYPWKSIQRAVNAFWGSPDDSTPASPTVAGQRRTALVLGGFYDEDIVLPEAGALDLISIGSVQIGTFAAPRSLTRIVDPTKNVDAPSVPTTVLSFIGTGGFLVFGPVTFGDVGAGQTQNLSFRGGGVISTFDASGQTAIFNIEMIETTCVSPVWNAPTGRLSCRNASFSGGAPTFDYFLGCTHSSFNSGISFATDPLSTVLLDTRISGTVTTPADFRVDFFTNGVMAANAVVKAGGWANTIPVGQVAPY